MFDFFKIQYKLTRIGNQELEEAVIRGWITLDQKDAITREAT